MKLTHRRLAALIAALQVVTPAIAATDLTDVPIAVKNTVEPNIMFTLDDSGSMHWEVMPDAYVYVYYLYPRVSSVYGGADYTNYVVDTDHTNRYARLLRSPLNPIYYNPARRYLPWSAADGSTYVPLVGTTPTPTTPTAAFHNPANTAKGTRNLTVDTTQQACWLKDDGTTTGCTTNRTFYPATYFTYNGGGIWNAASYSKVEIRSTVGTYTPATFPKGAARTDCITNTSSCTYAEEIQNFANWYTYYRSRILTARAGVGRAFGKQGTNMRVGFGAINKGSTTVDGTSTDTIISGVRKFQGTDRTSFFTNLYTHIIPAANTPLRAALDDVGVYFSRGTGSGSPWAEVPGTTSGTHHACRSNYHILMTDGYWNSSAAGTTAAQANVDGTNGPTHTYTDTSVIPNVVHTYTYTAATPTSDAYANTLADVASYYWKNDLRTDLADRVPTNSRDPAFWQHLVNFTVGLGVSGTVSQTDIQSALNGGTPTINWPDGASSQVDDLAHAAVNSHGGYFSAADPDTFANALSDALDDINARTGAAAAVAVANANITGGDNTSYASSYDSGTWTGTLDSFAVDVNTGIPDTTSLWTPTVTPAAQSGAQYLLDSRTPAVTDRFIVTYSDTGTPGGIQFQPSSATLGGAVTSKMSAAQNSRFNTPPSGTDGNSVIAYLRGDRTGESAGTYRTRAHLLGDIINTEPLVIRSPSLRYTDPGYTTWKTATAQANRTKMVIQGANDGMVHIFNGSTGAENWAYVPNRLIAMSDPSNSGTSTLNMLSRSTYVHRMYVDATPATGDVDFSNTDGVSGSPAPDWRTIAVGGLGKGGRGVYALDMTTPTASSESNAATKVLWEFPNSTTSATDIPKIGYVFGRPIIVKTRAKGWVVLVASGYNNGSVSGTDSSTGTGGDGHGYLFVLNARTGALITKLDTTLGSATSPAGLAHISAFVEDAEFNAEVLQVYGGDLLGNVWRFDLSDSSVSNWSTKRLAVLTDSSNVAQPVTTEPQLAVIKVNGSYKRFVYVGTGRYLGDADVSDSQTQTMYGLMEDLTQTATAGTTDLTAVLTSLRSNLQQQTLTVSGSTRTATHNAVNYTTQKGWYVDLPDTSTDPSERVNTNPILVSGALVFTSNIPSPDPCIPGGSSWLNVVDYQTGGAIQLTSSTWATASYSLGNALASRAVVVKTNTGLKALVRTSAGQTLTTNLGIPPGTTAGRRAAWREILK